MCDSDFPVRGCRVCARKQNKLYVEKYMALTIGLSGMFGLLLVVRIVLVAWRICRF